MARAAQGRAYEEATRTVIDAALSFARHENHEGADFRFQLVLTTGQEIEAKYIIAEDEWVMVRPWHKDEETYEGDLFLAIRHIVSCEVIFGAR
jgi:hypothetical protein